MLVIAELPVVVGLLVDDVDAVVAPSTPGRARMSSSSDSSPTEMPQWSSRGHDIGVLRDEEEELLDVVHLQHERRRSSVSIGAPRSRNVLIEVGDEAAVLFVEQVGRQAHRHVVQPRLAGAEARSLGDRLCRCHAEAPCVGVLRVGTIITLAARVPSCRPSAASSRPSSGTSSASTRTSSGTFPDASSSSARGKPSSS